LLRQKVHFGNVSLGQIKMHTYSDLNDKLKSLFKKHMDLGPNRPQYKEIVRAGLSNREGIDPAAATDEDFNDQYYHQLEYFDWSFDGEEIKYYGASYNEKPSLQGLFWGQENRLKLICDEFSQYLKNIKAEKEKKIIEATNRLKGLDVPCEKLCLTKEWLLFFRQHFFLGMQLEEANTNKIESPPQYGRFVLIES